MSTGLRSRSYLTVPNGLSVLRLLGCPVMLYLAAVDLPQPFLHVFLFLMITDWIDGKIARWYNQRTTLGARLDSAADAATYGCLLAAAWWLIPDVVRAEWMWVASALLTYVAAGLAGVARFRRWPAYHTRSAKSCWLLNAIGIVCLFAEVSSWPLRVAMVCVTVANLESLAITWSLQQWRTDVPSVFHAVRMKECRPDH